MTMLFCFFLNICYQGTIRLAGGSSQHEGRVEVYYNGDWGTVCDDAWDTVDAAVVCAELGYSRDGAQVKSFGPGVGDIKMDDVECTGSELELQQCDSEAGVNMTVFILKMLG